MTNVTKMTRAAAAANAAYSSFDPGSPLLDATALRDPDGAGFTTQLANRFLGVAASAEPFSGGLRRVAFRPDQLNGFSATLFRDLQSGEAILAVRGTNGPSDFFQDAQLAILGYASNQFISLYRYYRQLTTAAGEQVQYSSSERQLLRALNQPIPLLGFGTLSNTILEAQLLSDRGIARIDGGAGPVLAPGEQLTVTGHSLGGHLAQLFARAFPAVAESVYTFNAPGITLAGQLALQQAGLTPSNPLNIVNVVADGGLDVTAALGTRDGKTLRAFHETGPLTSIAHDHSIVQLSDSLAMYDLLAALSPHLGANPEAIKSILAAATPRPEASLETMLDMLSLALAGEEIETPIASSASDLSERDQFYQTLYGMRDEFADGREWGIHSLAGMHPSELVAAAGASSSILFALKHLLPFAVITADHGEPFTDTSFEWRTARADFTVRMLEAGTADRVYGLSSELFSFRYSDTDAGEHLSILNRSAADQARSLGSDALDQYLDSLTYDHVVAFGSDAGADVLQGTAGDDRLFGEGGDDSILALDGDDLLEGGAGDDTLVGGAGDDRLLGGGGFDVLDGGEGFDTYVVVALPEDESSEASGLTDIGHQYVIRDGDGWGEIRVGATLITGGMFDEDSNAFVSADGVHVYEFSGSLLGGGTLLIDGVIEVEDFRNGDLGIVLGEPDLPPSPFVLPNIYNPGRGHLHEDRLPGEGDDLAHNSSESGTLEGRAGNDALFGGTGNDTLIAGFASDDIDVPLPDVTTSYFNREGLSGGAGNDVLIGSGRADYLEGGPSSDMLHAGAGDDVILGDGSFMDYYFGNYVGTGDEIELVDYVHLDQQVYQADSGGRNVVLPDLDDPTWAFTYDAPFAGDEWIDAGPGNDLVHAGSGNDTVFGGAGDDELRGGPGNDTLHGGRGFDRVYGEDGNDVLIGAGDGIYEGGAGDDTLIGNGLLRGGPGADRIEPEHARVVLGDGDVLMFSSHTETSIEGEDGRPVQAEVEVAAEIAPHDVTVIITEPGFWGISAGGATAGFAGDLQDWSGISVKFFDGTVWTQSDLSIRAVSYIEPVGISPRYPTAGEETLFGTSGSDSLSGGAGADTYIIRPAGHDSIVNDDGDDIVHLGGVLPDHTTVLLQGQDIVLRYPNGELRLVGQVDSPQGVQAVIFDRDGTTWDRAELALRAVPDALEAATLGVQIADPGQAFAFTLPDGLFDDAYTVGTPSLEIASASGAPLPDWLQFDGETKSFSGTPQESDIGAVPLLVALRDAGAVVAMTPLVIAVGESNAPVEGSAPPVIDPPAPTPVAAPPIDSDPVMVAQADAQPMGESAEPVGTDTPASFRAVLEEAITASLSLQRSATPTASNAASDSLESPVNSTNDTREPFRDEPAVGAIEDATYNRIDSLLGSPATTHASGFLERYSEAMQEFRRRQEAQEPAPAEPPPTEEEIALYNAAMHAWLDRDAQRLSRIGAEDVWDFGGFQNAFAYGATETDRGAGLGGQSLLRPGLGGAPSVQREPGLTEGLVKISA